jgi:hypothetical protein
MKTVMLVLYWKDSIGVEETTVMVSSSYPIWKRRGTSPAVMVRVPTSTGINKKILTGRKDYTKEVHNSMCYDWGDAFDDGKFIDQSDGESGTYEGDDPLTLDELLEMED